jgi:hypothetical protein
MNILTFYFYRACTLSCAGYSVVHVINRSRTCSVATLIGAAGPLTRSVKSDLCVVASSYRTYCSCVCSLEN